MYKVKNLSIHSTDESINKLKRLFLTNTSALSLYAISNYFLNKFSSTQFSIPTIGLTNDYQYFVFEAGLKNYLKTFLNNNINFKFLKHTELYDYPISISSSFELRKQDKSYFHLAGLPFGFSVTDRLQNLNNHQNYLEQSIKNSNFVLFHLGFFNNTYGRFFKENNSESIFLGSTGLRASFFKDKNILTTDYDILKMNSLKSTWISDAYPHFYNSKFLNKISATGYMIDSFSRSSEALYLKIKKDFFYNLTDKEKTHFYVASKNIAKVFSLDLLNEENASLNKIESIYPISKLQPYDTFKSKYSQWLKDQYVNIS